MNKKETLNLISSLNFTPVQDAGGGFLHTPIQTIFQMYGGKRCVCWTDIAVAVQFNDKLRTVKNEQLESMVVVLTDYNHPHSTHRFTVNAPKSVKDLVITKPSTTYGKVVSYYFNDFASANDLFKDIVDKLSLNDDLYLLNRYKDLTNGVDVTFDYKEYLEVINTDVNLL